MKRWRDDRHKMIKQRKIHTRYSTRYCPLGRFRKKHALDCGNTRCYACHCDKLLDYKRLDEKIADLDMDEQLEDLENNPG